MKVHPIICTCPWYGCEVHEPSPTTWQVTIGGDAHPVLPEEGET